LLTSRSEFLVQTDPVIRTGHDNDEDIHAGLSQRAGQLCTSAPVKILAKDPVSHSAMFPLHL
jgi:hypothetical protein